MPSGAARPFPTRRSFSAASRRRCAASPITTTGPTRCAARSCSTPRPTCCSTAMPSEPWSKSRIASPRRGVEQDFSDMRGLAWLREATPEGWTEASCGRSRRCRTKARAGRGDNIVVRLPSFEQVSGDPEAYARASRVLHKESNPGNARPLTQRHGDRDVWLTAPPIPLTTRGDGRRLRAALRARAASSLCGARKFPPGR